MHLLRQNEGGDPYLTLYSGDNKIPDYTILSHTWSINDSEEVTLEDIKGGRGKDQPGYTKIKFCLEQTKKDGYGYCWIDSCCITRSNHTELSEAINSMYSWYKGAKECYVYLSDVSSRNSPEDAPCSKPWEEAFRKSRWFTRGWTLQELLAPERVHFYSEEGDYLTSKDKNPDLIYEITSIPVHVLLGMPINAGDTDQVQQVLDWMKLRNTKMVEDKIYSLIGILGVAMVANYGEKKGALDRLKFELERKMASKINNIRPNLWGPINGEENLQSSRPLTVSGPGPEATSMLDDLKFLHMGMREANVKPHAAKTCKWFLKHPSYLGWLNPGDTLEQGNFLWIIAKAGAGKSTMMKFLLTSAQQAREQNEILISFFFNARGYELEKSTLGLYRSLVYQLLDKVPRLRSILVEIESLYGILLRPWTITGLELILKSAVERLEGCHLKCLIDAVDECDEEEVRSMWSFLEGLGVTAAQNKLRLSVCFASRPYPTVNTDSAQRIALDHEEEHIEDIKKYLKKHLLVGKDQFAENVKFEIMTKANGVFLWVVLVVNILNIEYGKGDKLRVRKRLEETPQGLNDLFSDIIRRDSCNMPNFLLCLQWLLYAKRPLKIQEFYFAMRAGLGNDLGDAINAWDTECGGEETLWWLEAFVCDNSKGLVEMTRSRVPIVQFIHESVTDFLVKDNGLAMLWPDLTSTFVQTSHEKLKYCCERWLNFQLPEQVPLHMFLPEATSSQANDIRTLLEVKRPFLKYACDNILFHANQVAKEGSQAPFWETFDVARWCYLHDLIEGTNARRFKGPVPLLYILAEGNYPQLVTLYNRCCSTVFTKGGRYEYAFFAAINNRAAETLRALLATNDDAACVSDEALQAAQLPGEGNGVTPLLWSVEHDNAAVVRAVLSKTPDQDLFTADRRQVNPLFMAVALGKESVTDLLLKRGAHKGESEWIEFGVLKQAAKQGTLKRQTLLLDRASYAGKLGDVALQLAAAAGHSGIVKLLLDHGAALEARNGKKETVLHQAINGRHVDTVKLLLEKGADLGAKSDGGNTAILHAAGSGSAEMMQLLFANGANVNDTNFNRRTALHIAVAAGHGEVFEWLVNIGLDTEAVDCMGQTALQLATVANQEHAMVTVQ